MAACYLSKIKKRCNNGAGGNALLQVTQVVNELLFLSNEQSNA